MLWGLFVAQNFGLERELADYFGAEDAKQRHGRADAILELDADFDELYDRLRKGRRYSEKVATGLVEESRKGSDGLRQQYAFLVPEDYDPQKSYRVCFYLHGGVSRPEAWKKGEGWWRRFDRFEGLEQISVFPSSWRASLWWQSSQVENLIAILDRLKRDYNVDENRVYLFGVSDGGTAVYYHAAMAPTPWAAFFALIGHPGVLKDPATGVEGEVFLSNVANKPLFVVNGESDRLYPVHRVAPYIEELRRMGAEVAFLAQPGGHNTRWWNGERDRIEAFMQEHRRVPFPDRLSWQAERTDAFARVHWLVIEELSPSASSGRIDLRRSGNHVAVTARGIRRYRLLLSPEQFDFTQPIEVVTNGRTAFSAKVDKSSETLMRWAARDFDRTMLFAAELEIGAEP